MAIPLNSEAGPASAPTYTPTTLGGHTRAVTALAFSADGRTLVSAGADGFVHFWDAKSGVHQRALRCHPAGINDLSLSPDGLYFATASDDGTALIFACDPLVSAIEDHPPGHAHSLRQLEGHTAPVLSVAYGPRSNLLVTGSFDESAIVWDVRRGRPLRTLPAHADAIWSVGWDAEGALVITGSADGLIRLWDVNTGQCLKTLDNESNSPVTFASFTPSSFFILAACLSSTIRVYSLHTGKVLKTLRATEYVSERYPSPAIVFGAEQVISTDATAETDMEMDVDGGGTGTGAAPSPTPAPKGPVAMVVAGSENGAVVLWDLQERRVVAVLEGHTAPVVALAVSPDGTIASGSLEPEKAIRLWRR